MEIDYDLLLILVRYNVQENFDNFKFASESENELPKFKSLNINVL